MKARAKVAAFTRDTKIPSFLLTFVVVTKLNYETVKEESKFITESY
jgi:hypothetical protein